MSYFVLSVPGEASHFLICERCGAAAELQLSPSIAAGLDHLALKHGFAGTDQCMDLHGVCGGCQEAARKARKSAKPAKP
jgi:Fe2+ or Zn2+ uptake regulation protein